MRMSPLLPVHMHAAMVKHAGTSEDVVLPAHASVH